MPPANLHKEFFDVIGGSNTGRAAAILAAHPEAVTWLYTENGLNQPVTMIAHDASMLKLLLDHKADPNAADRLGDTRLIDTGDGADAAALMLDYGAEIDKPNHNGLTPLMRAAFNHASKVVELLLARGANPDVLDKTGRTAAAIARERSFSDLVGRLQECSVKRQKEGLIQEAGHFHQGLDHDIRGARKLVLRKKM